jgi:3-oxoadipate enol-lactonase
VRLHRHGRAKGPALLLIHGLSSSHHVWQRNLAALGAGHRLLVAELFSPGGGARFSLAGQTDRLAKALAEELHPLDVVGHSLGGLVALQLAAERPELVRRLVLADVPALPPTAPLPARLRAMARPGMVADARSVGVVARTLLVANPLQLLGASAVSVRSDLTSTAAAIRAPTLLVWGEDDALVPAEVGERLATLIRGSQLKLIRGAGHQPHWEAPEAFHAVILPFLERD